MSKLQIWGRMSSINVKKVVWTAQEVGLDFERHEAGGVHGVVKTPAYVALNPNSQIPTMEDGGYVLWESNVITRYLCAKHSSGNLYPTDLQERFDAERWMEWQQTSVNPASRNGFWHLIRLPAGERDPALVVQSNAAVELLMAMLETIWPLAGLWWENASAWLIFHSVAKCSAGLDCRNCASRVRTLNAGSRRF